jgi:serine/threonine-protein kinase
MAAPSQIAHYQITSKLGEGGMGEVWRATDTKLNRDVAVKILPDAFASDSDRMARFESEAKVLASLNHPNIAAIYGVEECALILELVEGTTLADRIALGAIPLEEALPIARQIAEALEYAHEHGIVHRDLKPANIKITPQGRAKVLDFGLAKAFTSDIASGNPAASPTLTMRATVTGVIMGTAAYMAPEQARGAAVDKRADIWAFGVVVHEMLTGRSAFAGQTISDTLAAVLRADLDWSALPAATPPAIRRLLRRCLEREHKRRLPDIGVAILDIDEASSPVTEHAPASPGTPRRSWGWLAAAVLALALLAVSALWWRASRSVQRMQVRLNVDLGPEALPGGNLTAAISPDGSRIVFPYRGPDGKPLLATRLLEEAKATVLPGTEDSRDPFFSPDSRWIGFFASGKLKKIAVQGGAPVTLCDASDLRGASWSEDGYIVATLSSAAAPLSKVPDAGGAPQALTTLGKNEFTHRWPQILPGVQAVLFTSAAAANYEEGTIEVLSLKTGKRTPLIIRGGYFGRYLPSGHLIYMHEGTLFGVRFDPAGLTMRGSAAPVLEDMSPNMVTGSGQFDFSRTGVFVYYGGGDASMTPVAFMDSTGKLDRLLPVPGGYLTPRLSPDGKRLALTRVPPALNDLWSYDWQREKLQRLTFTGQMCRFPLWTPDGKHIAFSSQTGAGSFLGWIRSDGATSEVQKILESNFVLLPTSFSPDGRRLAYTELAVETGYDIWTASLDTSDPDHPKLGKPEVFLKTPANERFPAFSPDGRWIAYDSTASGSLEVYVTPFPGPGGRYQISTGGGQFPIWSPKGRELFYETSDNRIMVAEYTVKGDAFDALKPRMWSNQQLHSTSVVFPNIDLAPDGKRFVVFPGMDPGGTRKVAVHVNFLLNFFDEMKRKIP